MMRARTATLAMVISAVGSGMANGMSAEELIFERSPYLEAARAVAQGDTSTLATLTKQGLDVNYEGKETKTPWGKDTVTLLLWAALNDSPRGAQSLLQAGADPNKATRRGMTPLMFAAGSKSDELFELLLVRYKADPNRIGRVGVAHSALTMALEERRTLGEKRFQRAEMLLRHGADINLDIDKGKTAAFHFTTFEDWRTVFWLLEHGANYEARNFTNATIMCRLRNSYRVNTLAPSEAYTYRDKVRELLLARGVVPSRVDAALHPSSKCDD